VAFDQPGVAARIADKKTGVVTSLDKLTADHLSRLLNAVLNDSTYRDNAHKLQKAIVQANGLSVAADLVEESLGVTKGGRRDVRRLEPCPSARGARSSESHSLPFQARNAVWCTSRFGPVAPHFGQVP
jgi:hypothetical protein